VRVRLSADGFGLYRKRLFHHKVEFSFFDLNAEISSKLRTMIYYRNS